MDFVANEPDMKPFMAVVGAMAEQEPVPGRWCSLRGSLLFCNFEQYRDAYKVIFGKAAPVEIAEALTDITNQVGQVAQ